MAMFGLLVILFTLVPALEFYLLFTIGSEIGAINTFAIIILTGVIGAFLAKTQGLTIIYKVQRELAQGKMPGKQIAHGFIVFGGGLLLLTPGFITDALGFCMVIPGTRHFIVSLLIKYLKYATAKGTIQFMSSQSTKFYSRSQETPSDVFEAQYRKREHQDKL